MIDDSNFELFANIINMKRFISKFIYLLLIFSLWAGEDYAVKNLEEGKKSYAVNFVLQDETKTMNDKQTDVIMQKIIANLEKLLGAKLR